MEFVISHLAKSYGKHQVLKDVDFSTHLLDIAVDLCDEIVLLNHGRLEPVDRENLDKTEGFDEMKKFKIIIISVVAMILGLCTFAALFYFGVLHINNPSKKRYPVVGVDVSAYQGEIDWEVLSKQKIDFAYIKATEGSSHVDACFSHNWENASGTNLRIGAYHFFSFESAGETQAKNYIDTVSPVDHMLPPVIDVEYYGRFGSSDNISVPDVISELRSLVDELTGEYGMKPVIYVSEETFNSIVNGSFDDCDIWYRSVYAKVPQNVEWKFWQFSNRHHENNPLFFLFHGSVEC